jgi:hypothetical protein
LAEGNRLNVLTPLLTIFGTSLANLLFFGPSTTQLMIERKHQGELKSYNIQKAILSMCNAETKDGKKSYDAPPHSKEMTRLNKQFGRMHGLSALANLGGFLATIWYGFSLASRLQ